MAMGKHRAQTRILLVFVALAAVAILAMVLTAG